MGYDLHITRRNFWHDNGNEITAEEWRAAIEADPELTLCEERGAHTAVWSGPSKLEPPLLLWEYGNVFARSPDAPLIDKMVGIADKLGARVQGMDGETYDRSDAPLPQSQTSLRGVLAAWLAKLKGK